MLPQLKQTGKKNQGNLLRETLLSVCVCVCCGHLGRGCTSCFYAHELALLVVCLHAETSYSLFLSLSHTHTHTQCYHYLASQAQQQLKISRITFSSQQQKKRGLYTCRLLYWHHIWERSYLLLTQYALSLSLSPSLSLSHTHTHAHASRLHAVRKGARRDYQFLSLYFNNCSYGNWTHQTFYFTQCYEFVSFADIDHNEKTGTKFMPPWFKLHFWEEK